MKHTHEAGLGVYEDGVAERAESLLRTSLISRIWERDASLWGPPARQTAIANRLGWLEAPDTAEAGRPDIETFAEGIRTSPFEHAVVLGMGGSSLCPEVLRRTFVPRAGAPALHVLDSTDPASVQGLTAELNWARTLFLVSTKSGTTIETLSFYRYCWDRLQSETGSAPAGRFVAITDPGTPLFAEAKAKEFRAVFAGEPTIGGRYSALTPFGLVPAALLGCDLAEGLSRARQMAERCRESGEGNPGLRLGVALAELAMRGRNKVTMLADPPVASVGLWLEQLLAESLGKEGKGLVPVADEPIGDPSVYGPDRLFVHLAVEATGGPTAAALDRIAAEGHPVLRLPLRDPLDLFAEFFRWEFATAVAAVVLGVNAFDEPNVSESKENTAAVLAGGPPDPNGDKGVLWRGKRLTLLSAEPRPEGDAGPALLADWLRRVPRGAYLALQAYLPDDATTAQRLSGLRTRLRDRTGLATTLGMGPRFLHSTGQLHKGGPPIGAFLQITRRVGPTVAIPDAAYDFGALQQAQAEGDARSLARRGRPLLRVRLSTPDDLRELESWLA